MFVPLLIYMLPDGKKKGKPRKTNINCTINAEMNAEMMEFILIFGLDGAIIYFSDECSSSV